MMSPTQFAVKTAAANRELGQARFAKNVPAMQKALAILTQLNAAYYGRPAARKVDEDRT